MRTIIIIDQTTTGMVTGEHRPYYENEKGEKIELSATSAVTYMDREEVNDVIQLKAKIVELQKQLRMIATKDDHTSP